MTTNLSSARLETLTRLAALCGFTAAEAVYVSATVGVFTASARNSQPHALWTEVRMVDRLFHDQALRDYFVEVIRKSAASFPAV